MKTEEHLCILCDERHIDEYCPYLVKQKEKTMVDNQHKQIKGYRDLSIEEIALMNKVKAKGEELAELLEEIKANPTIDQRWLAIGKTDLQTGLMAVTRSIAQPTTF